MPEEHVSAFLDAEERANQLVSALEQLTREVGSYRDAHQTLGAAGERIQEAANRLAALAGEADATIKLLRALGTPQILDQITAVSKVTETTLEATRGVNAAVDRTSGSLHEAIRTVATGLNGVRSDVEGLGKQVDARLVSQEQSFNRVQSSLTDMKKFAGDNATRLSKEVSTLKTFAIVNFVAILVVALIALLK